MCTKNVNNYKQKTFRNIFWATAHMRIYSDGSAKWNEVKEKPDKINKLILEMKADLKEGPGNI